MMFDAVFGSRSAVELLLVIFEKPLVPRFPGTFVRTVPFSSFFKDPWPMALLLRKPDGRPATRLGVFQGDLRHSPPPCNIFFV